MPYCLNCNKNLLPRLVRVGKTRKGTLQFRIYRPKKFCSHKCQFAFLRRAQTGENHPAFKGTILTCPFCKNPFHPEYIRKRKHQFCSKDCYLKWVSRQYTSIGNPFFGKKHKTISIETMRAKVKFTSKRLWESEEYRTKVISNTLKSLKNKPTKPEQKFIGMINKWNLPFKYIGNGEKIIAGLNPDFIDILGKNLIIEIFGRYWHTRNNMPSYLKVQPRAAIFRKVGYRLLVIWDDELEQKPEADIKNAVELFVGQN